MTFAVESREAGFTSRLVHFMLTQSYIITKMAKRRYVFAILFDVRNKGMYIYVSGFMCLES